MVKAFGNRFPSDQDLRSRLALPLDTSQMQTPRISTMSAKHQASPGSRIICDYPSLPNYALPPDVPHFTLPVQDQSPLQREMTDISTDSSPMYFNDYMKLHNQLATPLPLRPVNDSIYASSHGVIPNPSFSERSASAHQRYSHTRTRSYATSSRRSNPTTPIAQGGTAGDHWSYYLAPFPSEMPGGRGPHGDQGVAHGSDPHIHQNYSPLQQSEGPESFSTTSNYKHQTWEELARELGFHE